MLLQSCPILCDPIDGSPPGSPVPGILQARTLEWVAISFSNACMHAKSLQSCPTLCDPMDSSPPGFSVHGILQARILEWVAISFSIISLFKTILEVSTGQVLFWLIASRCPWNESLDLSYSPFFCGVSSPLWPTFVYQHGVPETRVGERNIIGSPKPITWPQHTTCNSITETLNAPSRGPSVPGAWNQL